mmetsp:Transcript_8743/g.13473  ORF Transcript_8743/g.13473 Transcript_8743/m.13473 type:complete len:159 (-) Transcript_8743:2308-2784(-)
MDIEIETKLNDNNEIKQRVNDDIGVKRVLFSVVGTTQRDFKDGLLYDSTIAALHALWYKMDYVHQGVLHQNDFQSARGVDPIWIEILDACDFDNDGNVTPAEFVAGFVMAALDKELSIPAKSAPAMTTGLQVMTNVVAILNAQIMEEIDVVKLKMGWR